VNLPGASPGASKRKFFILLSRGDSKEKAIMGAAAPKPPLAIPPHSKLWGFLAFSRENIGWDQ